MQQTRALENIVAFEAVPIDGLIVGSRLRQQLVSTTSLRQFEKGNAVEVDTESFSFAVAFLGGELWLQRFHSYDTPVIYDISKQAFVILLLRRALVSSFTTTPSPRFAGVCFEKLEALEPRVVSTSWRAQGDPRRGVEPRRHHVLKPSRA